MVPDIDRAREVTLVHHDGKREPFQCEHQEALKYAEEAARAFGVGESQTVAFDTARAKADAADAADGKKAKKAKAAK